MLFRSVHRHLCDAATNEHAFCSRFFSPTDGRQAFNNAFTKTLSATLESLENHLFTSHDPVALLLLLRLTHMFRAQMKSRGVNVLDNLHDRIDMLIWPRVKSVVDNNLRSVKAAIGSPKKLGAVDLHAHVVSKRYAEFVSSVLALLKGMEATDEEGAGTVRFGGKEMLKKDLKTLQDLMSQLLMSIANQHSTNKSKVRSCELQRMSQWCQPINPSQFSFTCRRSSSLSITTTA